MITSALTLLIAVFGSLTVALSVFVAFQFHEHYKNLLGDSKKLSFALSLQLAGEAIIGLGTLVFAYAAHFGYLPDWPVWFQSLLRLSMFTATAWTTWHLYKVIVFLHRS